MDANIILSPEALSQRWAELAQDNQLPDWDELTEHGEIVLSPKPTNRHQRLCAEIAFQLRSQLGGEPVVEATVLTTTAGVRIPDVVWMPKDRWQLIHSDQDLLTAPDIVVEVLSPENRQPEIHHKIQGYLSAGTKEVLVVGLDGTLAFYRQDGVHSTSTLDVTLSLPSSLFQ